MSREYRVERYSESIVERIRGYLPIERKRDMQRLVRINSFCGIRFRVVIDTEEIPEDVMITLGCFGDTGGWRSKFAAYINK